VAVCTLLLTFGTVGLTGPIAGWIADRFDRRQVMIVSDLSAAALFAGMGVAPSVGPLLAVAFAAALAETPFQAAAAAAIPGMVDDDGLSRANGLVELGGQVGFLVGPLLGGAVLAAQGAGTVFVSNSLSFVLSALLCWSVRGSFPRRTRQGSRPHSRDAPDGPRPAAPRHRHCDSGHRPGPRDDDGRHRAASSGARRRSVRLRSHDRGVGAGSVVGALAGRRLTARTEATGFLTGSALVAASIIAAGLVAQLWWVGSALLLMGDGVAAVGAIGVLQRRSPDAVRGRVVASLGTVTNLGLACSYLAAASIVDLVGPGGTYVVGGTVAALALPFVVPAFLGPSSRV
jgi:MFS family permease